MKHTRIISRRPLFMARGRERAFPQGMVSSCQPYASDYVLMSETAAMHASESVARFVEQEVLRPSKQWIVHVIDGTQESDEVILRTEDFVLLPDTERQNRYWRRSQRQPPPQPRRMLNWLAIALDRRLRSLRDLRGEHLPLLRGLLEKSLAAVERETGIRADQVMAYVHYPPSVYQLHVHLVYPYGQYCHRDAYRVHDLATVMSNLEIDPDYYAKAALSMAVLPQSLQYAALSQARPEPPDGTRLPAGQDA